MEKKTTIKTKKKAVPAKKAVKKIEKPEKAAKAAKETKAVPEIPEVIAPAQEQVSESVSFGEAFDEDSKKGKKYFEAVGRRKTAIARVRLLTIKPFEGEEGKITVNGKPYKSYFATNELQQTAEASLRKLKSLNRFEVISKVKGGGTSAQAEALRHGLARALVLFNADFRKKLKKAGYLKRDPRAKERRKYGLKKARRAPQWAKR